MLWVYQSSLCPVSQHFLHRTVKWLQSLFVFSDLTTSWNQLESACSFSRMLWNLSEKSGDDELRLTTGCTVMLKQADMQQQRGAAWLYFKSAWHDGTIFQSCSPAPSPLPCFLLFGLREGFICNILAIFSDGCTNWSEDQYLFSTDLNTDSYQHLT